MGTPPSRCHCAKTRASSSLVFSPQHGHPPCAQGVNDRQGRARGQGPAQDCGPPLGRLRAGAPRGRAVSATRPAAPLSEQAPQAPSSAPPHWCASGSGRKEAPSRRRKSTRSARGSQPGGGCRRRNSATSGAHGAPRCGFLEQLPRVSMWRRLAGPARATICQLLELGWGPILPAFWRLSTAAAWETKPTVPLHDFPHRVPGPPARSQWRSRSHPLSSRASPLGVPCPLGHLP